jgi:hypothetical protein
MCSRRLPAPPMGWRRCLLCDRLVGLRALTIVGYSDGRDRDFGRGPVCKPCLQDVPREITVNGVVYPLECRVP